MKKRGYREISMKKIIRIIKVICLINIICCLPLIIRNRKVINVDSTNRAAIQETLEYHDIDNKLIRKVSKARKFNNHVLYIHYWYGRVESKVILDGFHTTKGWSIAWENSYQERGRGFLLGVTSIAILIILKSLKKEGQRI